jgi:predicted NAD/FAD-binding protein
MRIAIIGSGIAGLTAAYRLCDAHEITVFEANDYIGGHTNTIQIDETEQTLSVDTGFIVFNDRTYPSFIALLDELGVQSDPTSMSFSVRCDDNGLEYNGTSINGVFAQRANLFRPSFYRMLNDILRFNREAVEILETDSEETTTVAEYLAAKRYSRQFVDHYLLPMGAAIWSCPPETFEKFPMRFIAEFYHHHGLLSVRNRPTWRVVRGGSSQYVQAMTRRFRQRIRLNCPVSRVERFTNHVEVTPTGAESERFDEVVFACHSDQALRMLGDASPVERELLGTFPYGRNVAVLHTDPSVLPKRKRAWASWNYHIRQQGEQQAAVTYNMNILQHLNSSQVYCVTLNETDLIDPARVIRRINYSHPIYTTERAAAQRRHAEVIRSNHTSFCGAYWGNGFHEDGVNSALAVCKAYERRSIQAAGLRHGELPTAGAV